MTRERDAAPEPVAASAMPTSSSPAAPSSDLARILNILAHLPAEDRAVLEPRVLPPWRLRRRRLDERDAVLRALAPAHIGDGESWPIARRVYGELARYVALGGFGRDRQRGRPPDDPHRALMFRAVRLHGRAKAPSRTTTWRALAGRSVSQPKIKLPMGC
jgi:hypothetical protein